MNIPLNKRIALAGIFLIACGGFFRTPVAVGALRGRIAFGSHHPDEPMRLWVMDSSVGLSSKVEVPLPQTFRVLDCTEWSRDGTWITFYAAKTGEWNCGIYVVKPDGSGFCQVTPDGMDLAHPSFSSDASQIIGCTSFYRLYICTKVGECDWVTEYLIRGVHPKWSPQGNKITYSNWGLTYDSDIFVYDLNTNTSTQITNHDPGKALTRAAWSPDGTKLAVVQVDHHTSKCDICIMNSDGSDLWNLTADWAASNEDYPAWSPDGQYIVFSSDISGNGDIWYTPSDHFDPVNIINSPEDEYMAAIGIPLEPTDPPIANAGDDLVADANEVVTLDASASYDPDGEIILYTWKRLPDEVVIYSGKDPNCQTMALGRVEEVIELTVTDNYWATATDTVRIINRTTHDLQDYVAAMQSQIEELQQQIQELQALVDKIASCPPIKQWLRRPIRRWLKRPTDAED